jgi:hypothetical protein
MAHGGPTPKLPTCREGHSNWALVRKRFSGGGFIRCIDCGEEKFSYSQLIHQLPKAENTQTPETPDQNRSILAEDAGVSVL